MRRLAVFGAVFEGALDALDEALIHFDELATRRFSMMRIIAHAKIKTDTTDASANVSV